MDKELKFLFIDKKEIFFFIFLVLLGVESKNICGFED